MAFMASNALNFIQFYHPVLPTASSLCRIHLVPFCSSSCSYHGSATKDRFRNRISTFQKLCNHGVFTPKASSSDTDAVVASANVEEDVESAQLFEKLKDAERQRVNKLEELQRKANLQLERQLVIASSWSRALLTMGET